MSEVVPRVNGLRSTLGLVAHRNEGSVEMVALFELA